MPLDLPGIDLREFPLFEGVADDVARRFLGQGFPLRCEAGMPLVAVNDAGETFFMILQGMAKMVLADSQGEELNVTLFRAGDFFGELAMLEQNASRSGNIVALTDMDVIAIQKNDFLRTFEQHPVLSLNLARILGQRLRAMNTRMMTGHLPDDVHKVAHTLMQLARKGTAFEDSGVILLPSLALKEWALFCQTTREGFMNGIQALKEQGSLEWQSQRIVITDLSALRRTAEVHEERLQRINGTTSP